MYQIESLADKEHSSSVSNNIPYIYNIYIYISYIYIYISYHQTCVLFRRNVKLFNTCTHVQLKVTTANETTRDGLKSSR